MYHLYLIITKMPLTKNKIKLFNSLKLKKYRQKHCLFVAEGHKIILDLINSGIKPAAIVSVSDILCQDIKNSNAEIIITDKNDIKKISNLKTCSEIIATFNIPEYKINYKEIFSELSIFCEDIQNPGNLGTIIRTADWFGIKNILCSQNTADLYNEKVVQASSGAIGRTKVHYVDTVKFLEKSKSADKHIYGTFLGGENIYEAKLENTGIIIIGNEGKGISSKAKSFVTKKLFIPPYPAANTEPESLNASIATAVICSEFRRRT